jgi:hypothetical protein
MEGGEGNITVPVPVYLIEHPKGRVLFDTGLDTDTDDLPATTIPLETLSEWCARIPARRLLIVLDCCFSGGMGAKALQAEAVSRDPAAAWRTSFPSTASLARQLEQKGAMVPHGRLAD